MCRTFAELDYSPLVQSGRVPAMITLTYPGDWEVITRDGASVNRHIVLWRKRFERECGEPVRYIWKLEFQRRGAPHIHLWMAPPMSPGRFWPQLRAVIVRRVGASRRSPQPGAEGPASAGRHRHRRAQRPEGLRPENGLPSTSPSIHHQTCAATRNISTSCLNCGDSPATAAVGSGVCTDSRRRLPLWRSPRMRTWRRAVP